ncbi:tannase/feruloyl esterase family alpha/beta hydrolase [Roseibium salinum]|uniref:Tannase/feruloyl esterase family alpha/beta hydrolase n=1 Tax=Roseibium salinum TaxID=1604349 RepID=A0ABT3QWC6_9HYPH|nr:tannase/feruloyl esterase family alpha/beta hydrolase [Roseibium sp. DSM 29163]MCX2721212.1 tannase/feruloyl esterase family alpha/beta hydrolase [Roseibium sp. DSM 29163]MDN3722682.1 tannase/feruloyl esterase family alpha/beta hydrolase [Roseibium salinum]
MTRQSRLPGVVAAALVPLAAIAPATQAHAQARLACEPAALSELALPGTRIVSAQSAPADDQAGPHCIVRGAVNERTGADGMPYAIGFEMRLPDEWNGRYVHQANGGNDGKVVPAYGDLKGNQPDNALSRGYAVLSTDAGHDGEANPDAGLAGGNVFGLDHQARVDYGYGANVVLTPIAKNLIEAYYGDGPEYSYMVGCSNGGRHALVGATRLADEFDGFLAGAPGYNLPMAAVQHAWDVQSFRLANEDIRKAFSPQDMAVVADGVLEACDSLDGAEDGIVGDLVACQSAFDLNSLQCAAGESNQCLAAEQVEALSRAFAGPTNSAGEQLYTDWSYDAGIASGDWRFWKLESPIPPWDHMPLIAVMGAGSLAHVFTTPPSEIEGTPEALLDFLINFDFDEDGKKILATSDAFPASPMDVMAPTDWRAPKIAELQQAGGKAIVFHGASDGVFSINATIDWYERLKANNGGDVSDFARFYSVPGMAHCDGGPATDRFDLFQELVDWVEKGEAPGAVVASVRADNKELPEGWSKQRTRPLCDWPQVARYDGSGDIESADSFTCR